MDRNQVIGLLDKPVRVTYDVGTKNKPHHVSQKGILIDYVGGAEKIYLTVTKSMKSGPEKEEIKYTSYSMLRYENIVAIELLGEPPKATA